MKSIPLQTGGFALVDDEDFDRVSALKWYAVAPDQQRPESKYAMAKPYDRVTKRQPTVWMHRFVVDCPKGMQVDHVDHDGLNNQRSNLRICTQSQNNANCRVHRKNKSGFRGVYPKRARYEAAIWVMGRRHSLGCYDEASVAARAYDSAAVRHFGNFATLNFPAAGR